MTLIVQKSLNKLKVKQWWIEAAGMGEKEVAFKNY